MSYPRLAYGVFLTLLSCAAVSQLPPAGRSGGRMHTDSPAGGLQAVRLELKAVWGKSGGALGELRSPGGLSVDFRGNLYVADTGNSRVQLISPNGDFKEAIGGSGAANRRFNRPADVCAELSFHLLVSDSENERIQEFDHEGNFLGLFLTRDDSLSCPWGIDLGGDGRFYVIDREDHRLLIVAPDGRVIDILGGFGTGPAQLRDPTFVAVDESERIIISDTGNNRLQLFDIHGGYLGAWASFDEGDHFRIPQSVVVGPRGEIYVADAGNARVLVLDDTARLLGAVGAGAGADGGPRYPTGMAVTSEGRLYVADGEGDCIFVYRVEYVSPSRP